MAGRTREWENVQHGIFLESPKLAPGLPSTIDSVHDVNVQNRPFPARIGSLLVLVHSMALLAPTP